MRNKAVLIYAVMGVLIGIFLAGCVTSPSGSSTPTQADLLKQSGFKFHSDQDEHVAYIQTLPAKKVVVNKSQDKPLYLICTDPDSKQCFLGDEAAYQRYQRLAIQQSIPEDQQKVFEERRDPQAQQMWMDSQGGG